MKASTFVVVCCSVKLVVLGFVYYTTLKLRGGHSTRSFIQEIVSVVLVAASVVVRWILRDFMVAQDNAGCGKYSSWLV